MNKLPFLFVVPLVAKMVARDWDRACHLLACTLDSILNQTDSDFMVALVCHDVPDIPQLKDPRIVVLQAHSKIPQSLGEQMIDKGYKKRLAFAYLRLLGGGWIMLVDADDLVSKRLVEYARKSNAKYGLLIDKGWEFDCQTKKLTFARRFNRLCGSSALFKFTVEELPQSAAQEQETISDKFESHRIWRETANGLNRPFNFIKFKAAVYTINNQQNHSTLMGGVGWKRKFSRFLSFSHTPSKADINEFSLHGLL